MKCVPFVFTVMASAVMFTAGCKKSTPAKADAVTPPAAPAPAAVTKEAPKDPNEVVASVNGVNYIRKDMEKIVASVMASQNIPAEQQAEARRFFEQRIVSSFIMKSLVMDEVKKAKIAVSDEDRKEQVAKLEQMLKARNMTMDQYFKNSPSGEETARKEFEEGLLIDKLIKEKVLNAIAIDDAEVTKYIADITAKNAELETANKNLSEGNKAKRAKIVDLKKKLDEGADFATLAKENSDCPSKEKGGDLGTFQRGQMVKAFEDAAFTQEIGKVGDIVETDFGYHLIRVTAKNPAKVAKDNQPAEPESIAASHILVKIDRAQQPRKIPTIAEVKEQLKTQKSQELVRKYLDDLKSKAKITTPAFPDLQF